MRSPAVHALVLVLLLLALALLAHAQDPGVHPTLRDHTPGPFPAPAGPPPAPTPPAPTPRATTPCSPTNYTKITNSGPLPADYCSFTYLPWRVRLPDHPGAIDQTNTTRLQTLYLPNSGLALAGSGWNIIQTLGQLETPNPNGTDGNGSHLLYHGSPSDPLIHIVCAGSNYGCGDMDGNQTTSPFPDVHIPAYARPSGNDCADCDKNLGVVSSDGTYIEMFGCHWHSNLVNGQTLSPASCNLEGASFGHIVTSKGVNFGNINAGDGQPALLAQFNEVMAGNIQHAIHAWAGCFTGIRWPGAGALECADGNGIPVGAHIYLDLTRTQIDDLSASDPTLIPPHMKPFAYAAHEHGIFALDTGNGQKWISQPLVEDAKPCLTSGACTQSFWQDWFFAHGGALTSDKNLKLNTPIDFSRLTTHMFVLDNCYVRGTCQDSVPECPCGTPGCPACPCPCGTPGCPSCACPCDTPGCPACCPCGSPGCPLCSAPPPPLALWPFNEGVGSVTHTSTTPDRPLTFTSPGPFWGGGKTGTSLECNDTGYASMGTFFPGTSYSWAGWFQPVTTPSGSQIQQPINAGGGPGGNWGFSWGHNNPVYRQAAFHRLSDTGTWVAATLPGTLPLNQWVHLAATHDGTTLILYLNGQSVAQTSAATSATPAGTFAVCREATATGTTQASAPPEAATRASTDQGLWGRAVPIADNAHPNLVWNQAEVDQLRTMLLTNHTPAWLWNRYVSTFQGRTAINWTTSDVYGYEPWTTNTRAAFTYMLEPTSAKADAIKSAVMSLLTAYPNGSVPSWFQTPWAMSGFPAAWLFDLLQAYHPEKLSATERQQLKTWYRQAAMSPGLMESPHKPDDVQQPITREGKTVGQYDNSASLSMFHALSMAAVSGDQATVDFWFDSGWPHDRLTYDGTNEPPAGTNRYDLAMHIYAIWPSGADSDTYRREGFGIDVALPLTSWKTNCYPCDADPSGNTKADGGDYSMYQGNPVALAAIIGNHIGMTTLFQGTPGQQLLNWYLLNWHSRTHLDYRATSLTGHPNVYTYPSNYVAMRNFSNNPELQAAQSSWVDTDDNGSKFIDWPLWPYLGYPFGVAGELPQTVSNPYARMDDLQVWNVALTPAQVQSVYQGQPGQTPLHLFRHATSIGLK